MSNLEETQFLARIRERPDEDGPRLIFADWLDQRLDPRGEFIRIQCALARLPDDDPRRPVLQEREQELLDRHADEWTAPLRMIAAGWTFHRGRPRRRLD